MLMIQYKFVVFRIESQVTQAHYESPEQHYPT